MELQTSLDPTPPNSRLASSKHRPLLTTDSPYSDWIFKNKTVYFGFKAQGEVCAALDVCLGALAFGCGLVSSIGQLQLGSTQTTAPNLPFVGPYLVKLLNPVKGLLVQLSQPKVLGWSAFFLVTSEALRQGFNFSQLADSSKFKARLYRRLLKDINTAHDQSEAEQAKILTPLLDRRLVINETRPDLNNYCQKLGKLFVREEKHTQTSLMDATLFGLLLHKLSGHTLTPPESSKPPPLPSSASGALVHYNGYFDQAKFYGCLDGWMASTQLVATAILGVGQLASHLDPVLDKTRMRSPFVLAGAAGVVAIVEIARRYYRVTQVANESRTRALKLQRLATKHPDAPIQMLHQMLARFKEASTRLQPRFLTKGQRTVESQLQTSSARPS